MDNRTRSAVSLYKIDESQMTANEIWTFDDNQAIYSPVCGGAFKTDSGLSVIDDSKNIYFDMRIPRRSVDENSCQTVFRARDQIRLPDHTVNASRELPGDSTAQQGIEDDIDINGRSVLSSSPHSLFSCSVEKIRETGPV